MTEILIECNGKTIIVFVTVHLTSLQYNIYDVMMCHAVRRNFLPVHRFTELLHHQFSGIVFFVSEISNPPFIRRLVFGQNCWVITREKSLSKGE